jgi:hypothetical protein
MNARTARDNESAKVSQHFAVGALHLTILPVSESVNRVYARAEQSKQLVNDGTKKSLRIIASNNGRTVVPAVNCVQALSNFDGVGMWEGEQLHRAGKGINYDKHLDVPIYILHWHLKDVDGEFTEGWLSNPATARCRRREGS